MSFSVHYPRQLSLSVSPLYTSKVSPFAHSLKCQYSILNWDFLKTSTSNKINVGEKEKTAEKKKSKCRVFVTIRKTGFPVRIISFSEFPLIRLRGHLWQVEEFTNRKWARRPRCLLAIWLCGPKSVVEGFIEKPPNVAIYYTGTIVQRKNK